MKLVFWARMYGKGVKRYPAVRYLGSKLLDSCEYMYESRVSRRVANWRDGETPFVFSCESSVSACAAACFYPYLGVPNACKMDASNSKRARTKYTQSETE